MNAGANINAQRPTDGSTALHIASQDGHFQIVDELLKAGADPNVKRNSGGTPLHSSVVNSSTDVLCRLVGGGADVTALDKADDTPLHDAARLGKLDVIKVFVEEVGAKQCLKMRGNNNRTPRKAAEAKGHSQVAEYLKIMENDCSQPDRGESKL